MSSLAALLRTAADPLLRFALPSRCPSCGVIVDDDHRFCVDCWRKLDHLDGGCACCGDPVVSLAVGEALCGACLADPPSFDTARAAVAYGEIARTIALRLKYGGRIGLARTISDAMRRHMEGLGDTLIVPVPLHRGRLWRRGFNQAALIGRALAGGARERLRLELLLRTRATPYLRGMGPRERARAVRGVFAVAPEARAELEGKRVVLVDDVYTSGATARACASALKRAGAAEVHIRCWARVVRGEGEDY